MENTNSKSDVKAKAAFIKHLQENGFQNAKVISSPSDIRAEKEGKEWFFEIKMTKRHDVYFGAATMTEWEQAFKTPDYFRFVIAIADDAHEHGFRFIEMTPAEMMQHSTIPPFKVYFNIDIEGKDVKRRNKIGKKNNPRRRALILTEQTFGIILDAFRNATRIQQGSLAE